MFQGFVFEKKYGIMTVLLLANFYESNRIHQFTGMSKYHA